MTTGPNRVAGKNAHPGVSVCPVPPAARVCSGPAGEAILTKPNRIPLVLLVSHPSSSTLVTTAPAGRCTHATIPVPAAAFPIVSSVGWKYLHELVLNWGS